MKFDSQQNASGCKCQKLEIDEYNGFIIQGNGMEFLLPAKFHIKRRHMWMVPCVSCKRINPNID